VRADELEREITVLVRRFAPSLLSLPGRGVLSAAKIVDESAGATQFRFRAAFARWNGTAPIPVWPGTRRTSWSRRLPYAVAWALPYSTVAG